VAARDFGPLGVFDSGLGGLTVVHALQGALPHERIVYLGDTARVPYGTRSAGTVVRYARSCARVLMDHGVKALVVACNTVSAVALDVLRAELDLPVIGVIEPGAQEAVRAADAQARRSGGPPPRVGVLGTLGTVSSRAYDRAVLRLSTRLEVVSEAAPLLVPLVEEGWLDGQVPELAVERYVAPLIERGARVIVLGCTHYPLLRPIIQSVAERLAKEPVDVVDSAVATARAIAQMMGEGTIAPATPGEQAERLKLLVTDQPVGFQRRADLFLGQHTPEVQQIDLPIAAS